MPCQSPHLLFYCPILGGRNIKELKRLIPYLAKHRVRLALGAVCLVVHNLLGMVVPWYVGRIIDSLNLLADGAALPDSNLLLRRCVLLILLALGSAVFLFFMRWLMIGSSRLIEYELRNDYFAHLLKMEQSWYQSNPVGDLMARATNDLNAVRMLLGPGIMYPINTVTTLAVALSMMFAIDWRLTLIGMCMLPLLSPLIYVISSRFQKGFTKIQEQFALLNNRVQENFSGIRVVKAFGREESEYELFRDSSRELYRRNLTIVRLMGFFMPTMSAVTQIIIVLIFFIGGRAVMAGELALGDLVAFMMYMSLLSWPMAALGWVTGVIQRGISAWRRILRVMDEEPGIVTAADIAASGPPGENETLSGELRIRDLHFSFGQQEILKGISLELPRGGSLGIIGPTGSGKTTLLRLIPRLLEPPAGTIYLGGRDLRELPLDMLRRSIAWVGQEPLLFSESLRENVAFGLDLDADDDETRASLEAVAREAAVLDEILAFPEGWRTQIGERGINLSGGQKQRLCLARALLKRAELLILDAPFSNVDTRTEERILSGLRGRIKGKSLILVSHRVSTVRMADQILVLDDGRIVERGRHEDLLALNGFYTALNERQLIEEELGEGRRT